MTTKKPQQRGKAKPVSGAKAQLANAAVAAKRSQQRRQKVAATNVVARAARTASKPHQSAEQQRVHELMLKHCAESKLDRRDVEALEYQAFTEAEAQSLNITHKRAGYKIPYRGIDGKLLETYRYRIFDVVQTGFLRGAPDLPRYQQPFGSSVEIYLPHHLPGIDWQQIKADTGTALYIIEGERKGACVTKYTGPCIALGGVFNFGGINLHPTLREFEWSGREVHVCFDNDRLKKPLVLLAEARLSNALSRLGAQVYIKCLPTDGPKGADDFIAKRGVEAFNEVPDILYELSQHQIELSALYCFIRQSSMILEYPDEHRKDIRLHNPETFCKALEAHRKIEVDAATGGIPTPLTERKKVVSAARFWLESPDKPTRDSITYAPGQPQVTARNEYNSWLPSGVVPMPGDTSLFDELVEHLVPDAAERDWLLQWFAAPLQQPGLKLNTAVMVWGAQQGTGKSLLGSIVGKLHGASNFIEIGQQELASSFNDWQAGRTFVMGSELCGERGSREFADRLKSIITAEVITINRKHQPLYVLPSCANYYLTSNHPNALFIDDDARRFGVFHASRSPLPQKFYTRLCRWLDNDGLGAILHKLLKLDVAAFEPKSSAPKTSAMQAMVQAGRSDLAAWCHALKEDPDSVLMFDAVPIPYRFATSLELLRIYERTNSNSRVNAQQIGNELAAAGFKQAHKNPISIPGTGTRVRLWVVRDHLKAANMSPDQIGAEYGRRLRPQKERAK